MLDMKHPGPWHHQDLDSGSVVDVNGVVVIEDFRVPQFFNENDDRTQEAEEIVRLVLAAPESFALVAESLCVILPQIADGMFPPWAADFATRCRHLVTRVLAQTSAKPRRPSYEELAAGLASALDVLRSVPIDLPGVPDLEQDPRAQSARALLARIEREPVPESTSGELPDIETNSAEDLRETEQEPHA